VPFSSAFGVKMAKLPFLVYRRKGRRYFYVEFKNAETGKPLPAISTGQETEAAAIQTAIQWLTDGIPTKQGRKVPARDYTLRDMARKADLAPDDAEFICKELRRRGLLKSYVMAESPRAVDFGEYLREFWDYDRSPYIREKLRKRHGLHRRYVIGQAGDAARYWMPFFQGRALGGVTWADIDGFISHLEGLPLSPKRKNKIITAGSVPLKWAFHRGMLDTDVSAGHTKFLGDSSERRILTPEQAAAVFKAPWKDERSRLANMLAMVTGMRACEVQGLRVQDLGNGCLYVRHAWNFMDGLKPTKTNESHTVEVPFPGLVRELLDMAAANPHGRGMDGYVFWAERLPDKPMEAAPFIRDLRAALVEAGMGPESAKAYTFHGWRHYFTSYMRDLVNEKLLKSQTGHKTTAMLDLYAGHAIAGDRERIRTAQIAAFGGLLPVADAPDGPPPSVSAVACGVSA